MQRQRIFDDACGADRKLVRPLRLIYAFTAFGIVALTVCLTRPANASSAANLVTNGDFQSVTGSLGSTGASQIGLTPPCLTPGTSCGITFGTTPGVLPDGAAFPLITNWTANNGLVFMFSANGSVGAPDGGGAQFQFGGSGTQTFQLWSTRNCASLCNGNEVNIPNACNLTGCGGNFIALDGDPGNGGNPGKEGIFQGSISQTISGLVAGDQYHVTFFTASGQQETFEGATETQLAVSLCGAGQSAPGPGTTIQTPGFNGICTFFTPPRSNPAHGFQPWEQEILTFTATSASETLNFLATGSPVSSTAVGGLPPVVLLDGISVSVVPEPATWSLIGIGFAALTLVAYGRAKWVGVPG
jgi:hypothetical protein